MTHSFQKANHEKATAFFRSILTTVPDQPEMSLQEVLKEVQRQEKDNDDVIDRRKIPLFSKASIKKKSNELSHSLPSNESSPHHKNRESGREMLERFLVQKRHQKATNFLKSIDPTGGEEISNKTAAELMVLSTSASCRNFFRARRYEESSSSSSSSSSDDSSQSHRSHSNSSSSSSDSEEYADGQPHSAKEISSIVHDGRVLPVRYRVGYNTLSLSTIIARYGKGEADVDPALRGFGDWFIGNTGSTKVKNGKRSKRSEQFEKLFSNAQRITERGEQPAEVDPYALDDPQNIGERRRRNVVLKSYRCTLITHADSAAIKEDIDHRFFMKHPECEARGIRLTAIRRTKLLLLSLCMEHQSPIDVATIVHAVCYYETLILKHHVNKANSDLVAAVCTILAVKFYETGIGSDSESNLGAKVQFAMERLEDIFGCTVEEIRIHEFIVFAKLEFDLLVPVRFALTNFVRLLGLYNITPSEHFAQRGTEKFQLLETIP